MKKKIILLFTHYAIFENIFTASLFKIMAKRSLIRQIITFRNIFILIKGIANVGIS